MGRKETQELKVRALTTEKQHTGNYRRYSLWLWCCSNSDSGNNSGILSASARAIACQQRLVSHIHLLLIVSRRTKFTLTVALCHNVLMALQVSFKVQAGSEEQINPLVLTSTLGNVTDQVDFRYASPSPLELTTRSRKSNVFFVHDNHAEYVNTEPLMTLLLPLLALQLQSVSEHTAVQEAPSVGGW